MIPHRTPAFLPWLYPSLTWRVQTNEPVLFLTFDDGPFPGPTDFVLEELNKARAHATFFCIGDNVRKYPSVFKKVNSYGHAVGNHTFNHVNGWKTPVQDYVNSIRQCDAQIKVSNPQYETRLFRPPYGRITRKQITALRDFKIIMWDVLSVDYNKNLPAEKCLRNTIAATRSGSIIVFHDSLKAEQNLMFALPRFLEHFSSKGYTFRSL
ncbi:MAG TPA: polysaccharide deacetylase family protein [Ohtaekwangia sp.]|nr:polysaccharide deacetylase family protein [Ohtaekwangia sp.]